MSARCRSRESRSGVWARASRSAPIRSRRAQAEAVSPSFSTMRRSRAQRSMSPPLFERGAGGMLDATPKIDDLHRDASPPCPQGEGEVVEVPDRNAGEL